MKEFQEGNLKSASLAVLIFLYDLLCRHTLRWLAWVLLATMAVPLSACASDPKMEWHSFIFDSWDMPDVCILNYRYGDTKQPGRYVPDYYLKEDTCRGGGSISGSMPRGDYLYVKWRIKATGEVYEETIDLKSRLPANITEHRISFVIRGTQLSIYLISRDRNDGCSPYITTSGAQECWKSHASMNGCPKDEDGALWRSTPSSERIFLRYCHLKIKEIYPDQPTTQSK